MDVQGLGTGTKSTVEHPPLERVHGSRSDAVGHDLQLGRTVDSRYGVYEFQVERGVHDVAMTVEVYAYSTDPLSNPRADARKSLIFGPVRQLTHVYDWRPSAFRDSCLTDG